MNLITDNPRVVIIEPGYKDYATEQSILDSFGARIEPVQWQADSSLLAKELEDADAILVRDSTIDGETIRNMSRCKIIARYGVGVDNIDLEAAKEKQIYVANVPDYGSEEVSDHAMSLLLATMRRIVTRDRDVRQSHWGIGQAETIWSLRNATVGMLGYGQIAYCFHRKIKAFGVNSILVSDPFLDDAEAEKMKVRKVDVDTLCAESNIISLHAPLTDKTRHIISADRFALMKPNTILVNTARGGLVDEKAMIETLREKRIAGAGIDVFEQEPPDPENPLFQLDNVVLTDHTGWYSEASVLELQSKAAAEVARVFAGDKPLSWLNPW